MQQDRPTVFSWLVSYPVPALCGLEQDKPRLSHLKRVLGPRRANQIRSPSPKWLYNS